MPGSLKLAAPTALEYFAALVADDASLSVAEAAIVIAQDEDSSLDPQGVLAQIDTLASRLRKRMPPGASPMQQVRLLNTFFFQELGFAGNVNDYGNHRNSYVHEVLRTRRGIPITLAVLYVEIAQQVGVRASGVSFPGHFLVKVSMPRGEVILDPFSGQTLSRDDLEDRLAPFRLRAGLSADDDVPLGLFLQAAPPREVIARILRNLKEIHRRSGDRARLAATMQRMVTLLPQAWEERRDLALVLAQLGQQGAALAEMAQYLEHRPGADDAPRMRQLAAAWGSQLSQTSRRLQ